LERRIRIFPIWYKIAASSRSLSTYFCRIWQEQKSEFFHRNANAFALAKRKGLVAQNGGFLCAGWSDDARNSCIVVPWRAQIVGFW
jgi:hypothetical protein